MLMMRGNYAVQLSVNQGNNDRFLNIAICDNSMIFKCRLDVMLPAFLFLSAHVTGAYPVCSENFRMQSFSLWCSKADAQVFPQSIS
jgi:hypothetical protein